MGREEEPDRLAIPNTKRDKRGQSRIGRDSAGAAVNRKVRQGSLRRSQLPWHRHVEASQVVCLVMREIGV
jgi:hypothetical protein